MGNECGKHDDGKCFNLDGENATFCARNQRTEAIKCSAMRSGCPVCVLNAR